MEKINFQNGASGNTPLNATNLNKLQENIENSIKSFVGSSEETGYCELPNGLIIQYGIVDLVNSTSDSSTGGFSQTVTFPKPFKSFCNVQLTPMYGNGIFDALLKRKSLTDVTITSGVNLVGTSAYWLAIGM